MPHKDFETIMKKITAGLTGNTEQDMPYLKEQMKKYKDHAYGKEIARACGRLLCEVIPDDMKEELVGLIYKDSKGFDAALEEIQFNIYKKEYDTALKLMEAMVEKYENLGMYADDEVSEYLDFKEIFEEVLYKLIYNPNKEVRKVPIRYSDLYFQYGSLLFELKRYDDAEGVLKKAMRWNPSNATIAFEHAETFKARGMMDEYYTASCEIFKIAFRPNELARCYRNLGYYYVEKENFQTAACCGVFSLQFEHSNIVQSELFYILTKDKTININPDIDIIKKCFDTNDIPFGPDDDIIGIAYQLTKMSMEKGEKEAAEYFISILLGFFETDELREMLEEISKM